MIDRLAIGTANFTSSYGIMSQGLSIEDNELKKIFALVDSNKIDTFDTALGYGDLFSLGSQLEYKFLQKKVITKFSLIEDFDQILEKLRSSPVKYHALLVHDPSNFSKIDRSKFLSLVYTVKELEICEKVGISIYNFTDLELFQDFFMPEIIQVPLNPLNQRFLESDFTDYVAKYSIEVHARSLFLQGILLANNLPDSLITFKPIWKKFIDMCSHYNSRLEVLLKWAFSKSFISKWIFGISCAQDLREILRVSNNMKISKHIDLFEDFKGPSHPLADPRNWVAI